MASLPSNSFMFNYNAKEYDAVTHTFPKTQGQLFDEDLVLNKAPSSYGDNYVYFGNSQAYMIKSYGSSSQNPINRSSSLGNSFTFIYKTSGFTSAYENLVANRDSGINWEVRGEIFHTATVWNLRMTPSSHPQIGMIRVFSDGSCEKRFLDDSGNTLQVTTESNVNWGNLTNGFGIFVGGSNFISEYFTQYFYWMYCSFETLSDTDVLKVIQYNEGNLSQFSIEPETMVFPYTGGTSALTITTDEGWTASTNDGWITLSSASGIGETSINITVAANNGQTRTGTVSVTDGNDTLTCSISQDFKPIQIPFYNIYYNGNRLN